MSRQRQRKPVVTLGRAPIADPPPIASDVSRAPRAARTQSQELLTPRELASRLKIDPQTVYRMTRERELPYIPVGKRVRYDFADVVAKLRGGSNSGGSGSGASGSGSSE